MSNFICDKCGASILDGGAGKRKVIYQGYGIFGDGAGLEGVTHWRPN